MPTTEAKVEALREAVVESPEYAEIVRLFVAVYEYVQGREGETGISFSMDGVDRSGGIADGSPLLSSAELSVDKGKLALFLEGVIAVLKQQSMEAEGYLNRMAAATVDGGLDPVTLLSAILERDRAPLDDAAARLEVPPPLVEYVFEIPLKTALERFASSCSPDEFAGWHKALCPVCGSRPGMSELAGDEGRRSLSCSACGFMWPFMRRKCPCCGCEDAGKLSYFTAGDGPCRVDACSACSRYIKTRDSRKGRADVPLEVEDILTMHLDLLASREGYERGK